MPILNSYKALVRNSALSGVLTKWFCFFCCSLFAFYLYGQELKTFQYDTENGLPSSEVYDIEIDSNGLIWFTTDRGVCTFDGYDFKVYTTADGLADNTNFEIFKDSRHRLWFTGFNNTLSIYEDGEFRPFQHNEKLKSLLYKESGKYAANFQEDKTTGELIFTQSLNKDYLFFRIDSCNGLHPFNEEEWKSSFIKGLNAPHALLRRGGMIYFRSKIMKWPTGHRSTYAVETDSLYVVHGKMTLYLIKKEEDEIHDSIAINKTIEELELFDGKIWVATSEGFCYYDLSERELSKFYLTNNYTTDILRDREGNYWISTVGDGLYRMTSPAFNYYLLQKNEYNNDIVSVKALRHNLYFGNKKATVMKIDKQGNLKLVYQNQEKNYQFNRVTKAPLGKKLVFTRGLEILERSEQMQKVNIPDPKSLEANIYYTLNNGHRLQYEHVDFTVVDSTMTAHIYEKKKNFSPFSKINQVYQCKKDTIWLATMNGLYKIVDYQYDSPMEVKPRGIESFGRINYLLKDSLENLWVSTIGKGLFSLRGREQLNWTVAQGLNSNMINAIQLVGDRLYMATNKGVNFAELSYKADGTPILGYLHSLTVDDGLSSNYVNEIEYWNGHIWLATNEGVNSFKPEDLTLTYPRIPVFIQSFAVGNEMMKADSTRQLKHYENDLSISYAAVSFRKPHNQAFYRYRLVRNGRASKWLETNEKTITFSDLSSGDYRFEVQARNKLDQWSNKSAVLNFEILPHFTRTPWFLGLAALYIVGLVFTGIRWRIKVIKNRSEKDKKLSAAQLKARESELTLLRNQMNPHFVFNALNSIQNFIFQQESEKANYFLTRFSSLMRKSLEFSKKGWISLEAEINYLEQYLEMESMRFPEKFSFHFEIAPDLDAGMLQIPTLLLQPVVENSVKHGFKDLDRMGKLLIQIEKYDEKILRISIEDNGKGIKEIPVGEAPGFRSDRKHGLQIVRDRIQLLQEEMPDREFSFELEPAGQGTGGTRAIFLLPIMTYGDDENSGR